MPVHNLPWEEEKGVQSLHLCYTVKGKILTIWMSRTQYWCEKWTFDTDINAMPWARWNSHHYLTSTDSSLACAKHWSKCYTNTDWFQLHSSLIRLTLVWFAFGWWQVCWLCPLCPEHHARRCRAPELLKAHSVCGPVRCFLYKGWLKSITMFSCICSQLSIVPKTFVNLTSFKPHYALKKACFLWHRRKAWERRALSSLGAEWPHQELLTGWI